MKSETKITISVFAFGAVFFAAMTSITSGYIDQRFNPKYEAMPPGFKLVCDGHGRHAAQFNDVPVVLTPYNHTWGKYSKRAAVKRAWSHYEYQQRPPVKDPVDEIQWHDCE